MKVGDFSEFLNLWGLSALDKEIRTLTFAPEEGGLSVSLQGMHIGAERSWSTERVAIQGIEDLVSVDGAMLVGALGLMKEADDLTVRATDNNLLLNAGGQKAQIRLSDTGARWKMPAEDIASYVLIDRSEIDRKLTMLTGVVSRTLDRPALTGINISTNAKQELIFRATDGRGRACILSHPTMKADGQFLCTAPAADLATTLGEFGRNVRIGLTTRKSHLHLSDETTGIRLSLLQGEYPSFQQLPREFDHKLVVPSSLISTAARAAALLDAARLVTLTVRGGHVMLVVNDQERGNYEVDAGETDVPEFEMHFDAEHLLQIAGAAGVETVFNIKEQATTAMVQGAGWYFWLTSTIRR